MERRRTLGVRAWLSGRLWGTPGWLLLAIVCAAVLGFAAEGAVRSLRVQPPQPLLVAGQLAIGFVIVRWKLRDSRLALQAVLAALGCGLIALAVGRLGLEADALLRGAGAEEGPLGAPMLLPSLTFAVAIAAGTNLIGQWRDELTAGPMHAAVERALDQVWAPLSTGLVLLATLVGAFVFSDQAATQRIATLGAACVLLAPPWGIAVLAIGLRFQSPGYLRLLRAERAVKKQQPASAPAQERGEIIAKPHFQPTPFAQQVVVRKNVRIDPAAPPTPAPTPSRDPAHAEGEPATAPLDPANAALQARLRGLRRRSPGS